VPLLPLAIAVNAAVLRRQNPTLVECDGTLEPNYNDCEIYKASAKFLVL
jgi:hypothetical protein